MYELRGMKNPDGSYSAGVWFNGLEAQDADLVLGHSTEDELRELYCRVDERFHEKPSISGDLIEAFPMEFLEAQALGG